MRIHPLDIVTPPQAIKNQSIHQLPPFSHRAVRLFILSIPLSLATSLSISSVLKVSGCTANTSLPQLQRLQTPAQIDIEHLKRNRNHGESPRLPRSRWQGEIANAKSMPYSLLMSLFHPFTSSAHVRFASYPLNFRWPVIL